MILSSTSDIIRIVTTSTADVQVNASWADQTTTAFTPGRTNTIITTATTTTVVASPSASTQRQVKTLVIANRHASASNTVTVQHYDGTTSISVFQKVLLAGQSAEYSGSVWSVFSADGIPIFTSVLGDLTGAVTSSGLATTLIPTTSDAFSIGDATHQYTDLFLSEGAVINWDNGDVTLTQTGNELALAGGNFALGANSLTMTGSIGATGARVTKLWATDIESTNIPTVGGTALLTSLTAPQFTTIELGHASDTTLSRVSAGVIAVEGVTIPTISSTSTITNKRNQPRIVSASSYTTDTGTSLDVSTCDVFIVTAQAGALKFNNPSGTPVQGEKLIIRIKDNGTARALTYDTQFRASSDLALPTTTIISKTLYMGFIYNSTDTKWDLLCVLNNI